MKNETTKTHWKSLHEYDFLGAYSLEDGKDLILTIKEVKKEEVIGEGGRKEFCAVCYWKENQKPMVLNKTNAKTIQKLYNTPYIEEWVNKKVQIYEDITKFRGELVECLRIRPRIPGKPTMDKNSDAWNKAVKFLAEKGIENINKVTDKYIVDEKELKIAVEQRSAE